MIPGREPIPLTCCALALMIAVWPGFSRAAAPIHDASNTWASGQSDGPANPSGDPGDAPQPPSEGSGSPSNEDADVQRPEATRTWPDPDDSASEEEERDPWLDQEPASRRDVPPYSLWLGPGLSWSVPFGDLWGRCSGFDAYGRCALIEDVPVSTFFGSGPALEIDAGARLGRHYNLYALWERTWFSKGNGGESGGARQSRGESDFLALGLRVTTVPEKIGFVLDVAVGTRRMRARWQDGTELQLTDAPFETRLGVGADVRLDENWSFTPLLHLGLGSFGRMQWVLPDKTIEPASAPGDVALTHGWVGLQVSAHADILGSRD